MGRVSLIFFQVGSFWFHWFSTFRFCQNMISLHECSMHTEKNVYSTALVWNILEMSVISIRLRVLFSSAMSFVTYFLFAWSICRGLLKSPNIRVYPSISHCISISFCLIFWYSVVKSIHIRDWVPQVQACKAWKMCWNLDFWELPKEWKEYLKTTSKSYNNTYIQTAISFVAYS